MINRSSVPANPYIEINPEIKNFFDFTPSDFIIRDYPREEIREKNPDLKFEIARF